MDLPPNSKTSNLGFVSKPKTLYVIAIEAVSYSYKYFDSEICIYPADIYFDILYELYSKKLYYELLKELSDLEKFSKALKATSKRLQLHISFQAIMDLSFCSSSVKPSSTLAKSFIKKCTEDDFTKNCSDDLLFQGLSLAAFMSEAGWLEEAESILLICCELLKKFKNLQHSIKLLECYQRLIHVQNGFCKFKSAEKTFQDSNELVSKLQKLGHCPNLALLYSEFSTLHMLHSNYTEAYSWSVKALQHLAPNMYEAAIVDVLRQSAKSCVLKREFEKAGLLINQAFKIARGMVGERALKYADTLIDFGFYLLNVDRIKQGIEVYECALFLRKGVFGVGSKNLHVATAYEDLSYASYVHNYSDGYFQGAKNQAEKAISLLLCLLPKDHLLLSSCKRVKALILEEMAIENSNKEIEAKYLDEAHTLHKEALQLALQAFGEMNVQTAKHYGNLGRLYQSMKEFQKAEEMHLKAIHIKETLLGPDDYEVALSVGHLASLYNYDLGYYTKAESLYLRSMDIGIKLFGEAYSGLEYDYRGLLRVYANLPDIDKRLHYMNVLSYWKEMREGLEESATSPFSDDNKPLSVKHTIEQFMAL